MCIAKYIITSPTSQYPHNSGRYLQIRLVRPNRADQVHFAVYPAITVHFRIHTPHILGLDVQSPFSVDFNCHPAIMPFCPNRESTIFLRFNY